MPLPLPKLDNQTYDALVEQGRALIPRYAPDWTDHNAHDPGITLLELLAWITEIESYRLDRVSDATARAFLRLIGITSQPAQVADTTLVVQLDDPNQPLTLPERSLLTTQNVRFQTVHPLSLSPARLVAVLVETPSGFTDQTTNNQPSGKRYQPLGVDPEPGCAFYLGFDRTLSDDPRTINLYIWGTNPEHDRETRAALGRESDADRTVDCDVHYSVHTAWEYHAGEDQWLPLTEVTDETRGFTMSGAVSFKAPDSSLHQPNGTSLSGHSNHYFVRCRIVRGGYDCPPEITLAQINTVKVRHAVDAATVGTSSGQASQKLQLPDRPVVSGSTRVKVIAGATEQDWSEQQTWDRVGPGDSSYVLNAETGELVFGNGRTGMVPKAGAQFSVTYQIGSGPAGNVSAGSEWSLDPHRPVSISQPFVASGGRPAELLFDARARAVDWLSVPQRAITLEDFERLALATPGVPVARAKAIADYDPRFSCLPAPGSVTVVVISQCPQKKAGPAFLKAVERYLEPRRMLTTELHVIGPDYITVAVTATLHATVGVASNELAERARNVLNEFFDPLRGGPGGTGWPFGRAVYRAEILALLNGLAGVVYVDGVVLEALAGNEVACCASCQQVSKRVDAQCGNVEICPQGLVLPGAHRIAVVTERVNS